MPDMNTAAKELFLIITEDDDCYPVRGTKAECQQFIDDHIDAKQPFRVRRITDAPDVTDDFFPAADLDAPSYAHEQKVAGADYAYRMGRG